MALAIALIAGTALGDDAHFPFGPMRMYSTRNDPNGTLSVVLIRAETLEGSNIGVSFVDLGLRRAEVDGLINRFENDSLLARYLMQAYRDFMQRPLLQELSIIRQFYKLSDGEPVDSWEETMGRWTQQ